MGVKPVGEGGDEEDQGCERIAREIGRDEEVRCAIGEAGDGAEVKGEMGAEEEGCELGREGGQEERWGV